MVKSGVIRKSYLIRMKENKLIKSRSNGSYQRLETGDFGKKLVNFFAINILTGHGGSYL